jgi:hypothetical protein
VTSSHIAVALGNCGTHSQVAIFTIHVVGSRPGVVSEPDAEIFDLQWLPLAHFLDTNDLAGGLLELSELAQEIPESKRKLNRSEIKLRARY